MNSVELTPFCVNFLSSNLDFSFNYIIHTGRNLFFILRDNCRWELSSDILFRYKKDSFWYYSIEQIICNLVRRFRSLAKAARTLTRTFRYIAKAACTSAKPFRLLAKVSRTTAWRFRQRAKVLFTPASIFRQRATAYYLISKSNIF